eukprot:1158962-Pelagomonas_calceolata.AAC.1
MAGVLMGMSLDPAGNRIYKQTQQLKVRLYTEPGRNEDSNTDAEGQPLSRNAALSSQLQISIREGLWCISTTTTIPFVHDQFKY